MRNPHAAGLEIYGSLRRGGAIGRRFSEGFFLAHAPWIGLISPFQSVNQLPSLPRADSHRTQQPLIACFPVKNLPCNHRQSFLDDRFRELHDRR